MSKNGILRTLRLEKRLSKSELSEIFNKEFNLNIDKNMISQWESGLKTPIGANLLAYTKIFNISLNYISTLIDTSLITEENIIEESSSENRDINIVKRLREELGLSQEELAEKVGYKSKKKIEFIENGRENIPASRISKFAKALKTTKKELLKNNSFSSNEKTSEKSIKPDIVLESGHKLYFDIINNSKIVLHYFDNSINENNKNNEKQEKIIELNKDEIDSFNKSMSIVNILFDSPYINKSDKFALKREALKCYIKGLLKDTLNFSK